MWDLAKKEPKKVEELIQNPEIIEKLPDAGDGNAVFMTEGTQEDFDEYEKEQSGLKKFLKKIGLE